MKKLLIIIMILIVSGCTKLSAMNNIEILENSINSKYKLYNEYRTGYKYYLPSGLFVENNLEYNEIIKSSSTTYYLYIDIVSYYNKVKSTYIIDNSAYYSVAINTKDNSGYLEINYTNNKYLVEMMYNYAKIEVMVDENMLPITIQNCISILSSIKYNKEIIDNLMGENVLNYSEQDFDIFTTKKESSFKDYLETYDNYEEEETDIPDLDIIE